MNLTDVVRKFPDFQSKLKIRKDCLFLNWDKAKSYDHAIKEGRNFSVPFFIIGDAKYPPIPNKMIQEYYLFYDHRNFIGEEAMILFKDTDKLFFMINTEDDYLKIRLIIHKIVLYGSNIRIILITSNMSSISPQVIETDCISDIDIINDTTNKYLPYTAQLIYRRDIIEFEKMLEKKEAIKPKQTKRRVK